MGGVKKTFFARDFPSTIKRTLKRPNSKKNGKVCQKYVIFDFSDILCYLIPQKEKRSTSLYLLGFNLFFLFVGVTRFELAASASLTHIFAFPVFLWNFLKRRNYWTFGFSFFLFFFHFYSFCMSKYVKSMSKTGRPNYAFLKILSSVSDAVTSFFSNA